MKSLSLDLSSHRIGWSIFKDNKLDNYGNIIPKTNTEDKKLEKLYYLASEVNELFKGIDVLLIEDIYVGINPYSTIYLARLSGAVIQKWMEYNKKNKEPILVKANHVRKELNLAGNCHKTTVQCFILDKFKLTSKENITKYNCLIEQIEAEVIDYDLSKTTRKSKLDKITKLIEEETGVGEDVADSLLINTWYNTCFVKEGVV